MKKMDTEKKGKVIFKAAIVMAVFLAMCVPASARPPPTPQAPISSDWATVAPSIDGDFSDGEWENAQLLIPSPIHTYVYFMNDNENLYICVDAANGDGGDYTEDAFDYCDMVFDTDPHEVWTPGHEDIFAINGTGYGEHLVARNTSYSWIRHCYFTDPGLEGAAGFGTSPNAPSQDHRIYEFKIPLSLLTASPGDTLGFASPPIGSIPHDSSAGESNFWPPGVNIGDLATWGDLILASTAAPTLTPTGLIALVSLLSAIAAVAIVRKRR
jgi:hypothetical protein